MDIIKNSLLKAISDRQMSEAEYNRFLKFGRNFNFYDVGGWIQFMDVSTNNIFHKR